MPDEEDPSTGAIDTDVLQRIAHRLRRDSRFEAVLTHPEYAPNSVVAAFDTSYYPTSVSEANVRIRWFETDDFSIHYREQYEARPWECRWDRHPNSHNTRDHVHPPPDAATPGENATFASDWRDVLSRVLRALGERIESLWE